MHCSCKGRPHPAGPSRDQLSFPARALPSKPSSRAAGPLAASSNASSPNSNRWGPQTTRTLTTCHRPGQGDRLRQLDPEPAASPHLARANARCVSSSGVWAVFVSTSRRPSHVHLPPPYRPPVSFRHLISVITIIFITTQLTIIIFCLVYIVCRKRQRERQPNAEPSLPLRVTWHHREPALPCTFDDRHGEGASTASPRLGGGRVLGTEPYSCQPGAALMPLHSPKPPTYVSRPRSGREILRRACRSSLRRATEG